jgi:membrane protease subunit (stomatin/prohibitin family)
MMMGQQMVDQMKGSVNSTQQTSTPTMQQANSQPQGNNMIPRFCPNCGQPTNGANFCGNCGNKLV